MHRELLQKYFTGRCTVEEIEQVTEWFQSADGQKFLEERIDKDMSHYADSEDVILFPDVPSDEMLHFIKTALGDGKSHASDSSDGKDASGAKKRKEKPVHESTSRGTPD